MDTIKDVFDKVDELVRYYAHNPSNQAIERHEAYKHVLTLLRPLVEQESKVTPRRHG